MSDQTVKMRASGGAIGRMNASGGTTVKMSSVQTNRAGGTSDYEKLKNLPTINGELVISDKTYDDYHFHKVSMTGLIDDLGQEAVLIIGCGTSTEVV